MAIKDKNPTQLMLLIWAVVSTLFAVYDKGNAKEIGSVKEEVKALNTKLTLYLETTHNIDKRVAVLEVKCE